MRYVFTNRTVTPMPDKDARDSFFERCTFQGDFRGYDFRNASFAHCTMEGDFSDVQTKYMTSFMSDWSKAILPPDISSSKQDLVVGVVRRGLPNLTQTERDLVLVGLNFVIADSAHSWIDGERQIKQSGRASAEMLAAIGKLFGGYPTLLERLRSTLAGEEGDRALADNPRPTEQILHIAGTEIDLLRDPRVRGEDRWAIERSLEVPGWRVHLFTLHPWPYGKAAEEEWLGVRASWWDWWRGLGGNQ
ncbi:hypothetical protein LCGC14_1570480 [marine sediment metagenome]|uniref:Uncharacterized protein n=1 Tax=marine sediment metagenome TaxID=412755 RepID=A0A0F9IJS3_9ZZZZ